MSLAAQQTSLERQVRKSDVVLSQADLQRFSELLLRRCGLRFAENRHAELEHGIRQAFAASTCATIDEFYDMVEAPQAGAVEMDLLVNSVTVSETHFFRDEAQFDAIYNQVLPQIIKRKQLLRTLRIWSAGCASGEEPFARAVQKPACHRAAHLLGRDLLHVQLQ